MTARQEYGLTQSLHEDNGVVEGWIGDTAGWEVEEWS